MLFAVQCWCNSVL